MEEDREENQSNHSLSHSPRGSDDGGEIYGHFGSSDEERENERDNSFSHSARSDDGDEIYGDARYRLDGASCSSKRRKFPKEDRISDLPDSVIHHILSFLPAEDAVKTGALSKRWMYLWTSVPKLTFRHYSNRGFLQRFLRFVDETLFLYSSSKMEKFELDFDYIVANDSRLPLDSLINKWVRLVTIHDAEELSLKFCRRDWIAGLYNGYDRYLIPQFVFNSYSLTKLSTRLCDFKPKGQICWTSLRVLTIEHTELSNNVLQWIFSGSPMLQHMKLYSCWGMTSIDVSSSHVLEYLEVNRCWPITCIDISSCRKLEKLVLREIWNPHNEEEGVLIKIVCPCLKSLEISGNWHGTKFRLFNVPSLIDVCLTFEFAVVCEEYIDIARKLIEKIKHVKQITLGTWCTQVLSVLEYRGLPSPLSDSNCKSLTLNTGFNKWYPFGVASLLHCLPTLEKLVIDMKNSPKGENVFDSLATNKNAFESDFGQNYWKTEDRTFNCLFGHLKTIEIVGLDPSGQHLSESSDLLEFVRFLLRNARVLKKVVVVFGYKVLQYSLWEDELFEVTQKLLSFPRCSPQAVVLIN